MNYTKKGIAFLLMAVLSTSVFFTGCGDTEGKEEKQEKQEEVKKEEKKTGKWISDPSGYRYERADKTSPAGQFEQIDNLWYYFDNSGLMLTGWINVGADSFYLHPDGHMAANEVVDGVNRVGADGKWIPPQWKSDGTNYWYEYSNGTYPKHQFVQLDGKWYYFKDNGYMAKGWENVDGSSYYFYQDGHMAANETIDGSYVDGNGRWVKPQPKPQPKAEPEPDISTMSDPPEGAYTYDYETDSYISIDDPYDMDNWDRYDVYY